MAQDTNLDPLGDGSLHTSFTLNDTPTSLQGTNTLSGTQSPLPYGTGKIENGIHVPFGEDYATLDVGLAGDQDLSFAFWAYPLRRSGATITLKDYGYIAFGGIGARYNIEFQFSHKDNSCILKVGAHKFAITLYPGYSISVNSWHLYTVTYNLATQSLKFYIDDVLKGSGTLQMKWISNPIAITTNFGTDDDNFMLDQIMVFTKTLSLTDIQSLMAMTGSVTGVIHNASSVNMPISVQNPNWVGEIVTVQVTPDPVNIPISIQDVISAGTYAGIKVYPTAVDLIPILPNAPTIFIHKVYDYSQFVFLQGIEIERNYQKFNIIEQIEQTSAGQSKIIVRVRN